MIPVGFLIHCGAWEWWHTTFHVWMYDCLSNDPHWVYFIGPKDPIPLRHFGLKETKAKVDLMEDQYDLPMTFNPDLIPDLVVAGQNLGAWGQGVAMYGAARGYRWPRTMPTLLASMLGFECEKEMEDTKQYLLSHGGFQLEQVGGWWPTVISM